MQISNVELCTLSNGLNLSMSAATFILRKNVFELVKPLWKTVIGLEPLYYKITVSQSKQNKLVKKPALPVNMAIIYLETWIPEAIDKLRNIDSLKTDIELWDQATCIINNTRYKEESCIIDDGDWLEIEL